MRQAVLYYTVGPLGSVLFIPRVLRLKRYIIIWHHAVFDI